MKRKLLLTLAAIVATITAGAQTVTQGSLDFMADVHEMFIECEFDQAIVYDRGNLPIAQWGVERDDECDEPTGTFMNNLADVEVASPTRWSRSPATSSRTSASHRNASTTTSSPATSRK